MEKKIELMKMDDGLWLYSCWTGEIVRPWELRKVVSMVRDLNRI